MSDNQSWNHAGIYGDSVVKMPNMDQVAGRGVRFTNAFCNTPSCSPARAALLTGQDTWRLEDGASLWGIFPQKYQVYTNILENAGYAVGYQDKGWGSGSYTANGWPRNPVGNEFNSFEDFLKQKKHGQFWTFWFGSKEPHRPYKVGSGKAAGIDLSKIKVPGYLPDAEDTRIDIGDYYAAIQHFDSEIGNILDALKKTGEADNTVIAICSDNGWQMPRGLVNLYDFGTRIPMIISWPGKFKENEVSDRLVLLNGLAPTFLQLADVEIPGEMTAKSLLPVVDKDKTAPEERSFVVLSRERHAFVRRHGLGYPGRAIRTKDYLYIKNYEPGRWPGGDPPLYGDVDPYMLNYPGPTKFYMIEHKGDEKGKLYFDLAFAKRPAEELYDVNADPCQMHNMAANARYASIKKQLSQKMEDYLMRTKDPRVAGGKLIWDGTAYFSEIDKTPKPSPEAIKKFKLDTSYNYLKLLLSD